MHMFKTKKRAQRVQSALRDGRGNPAVGVELSKEHKWQRKVLINKQGGCCALCGVLMTLGDPEADTYVTVDHIVPKSKGGTEDIKNKQALCRKCNQNKADT